MVEQSLAPTSHNFVWKGTLNENELPVLDYRHTVVELTKDKAEKEKDPEVQLVSDKVVPKILKFPVKMTVFHENHGYLEIKKQMPDGKYQCKFIG
jgi:hypothetical protein